MDRNYRIQSLSLFQLRVGKWRKSQVVKGRRKRKCVFTCILAVSVQIRDIAGFLHGRVNPGNKYHSLVIISAALVSSSHTAYSTVLIILIITVSISYLS